MNRPVLPEVLWHYTDANGLFGIVTSAQLRFGDVRFLNDRTERVYGDKLKDEVFEEMALTDLSGVTAKFRNFVRVLRQPERLYICSFSATTESISQWQRYGSDGNGYCIGFLRRGLDELFDSESVWFKAMLYDEAAQKDAMRTAIATGLKLYQELQERESSPNRPYYEYLSTDIEIDSVLLQVKNRVFHDEEEWRYLFRSDPDDNDFVHDTPRDVDKQDDSFAEDMTSNDIREAFAVRGSYVKPFITLPRTTRATRLLPIVGVICGPKLDGDLAVTSARRFLVSRGYGVQVEHSKLAEIWR